MAGMVNDNSYTVADIFADCFAKVFTLEPFSGMPIYLAFTIRIVSPI